MMNRRGFLGALGVSALLPPLRGISESTNDKQQATSRSRLTLNGEWKRYIHGQFYGMEVVPSAHHPVGQYTLTRTFPLPRLSSGRRVFLCFEAITYYARVSVNGKLLGEMGPYVPFEFEFTSMAREGNNQVEVEIADLTPFEDGGGKDELALGVNPGWEAYGGIIRDVSVELRSAIFVEQVRLSYQLSNDFEQASCHAEVFLSQNSPLDGEVELILLSGDRISARGKASVPATSSPTQIVNISFTLTAPALWSPDTPRLYDLQVRLGIGSEEDFWQCRTGFREIRTEGRDFLLNGKRLVLNGVCRHDMWKDQGFTLSQAQQQQDMRMIKDLGCNFVRLVHYPHDRRIVALADELGLLVTEEPGYWIMDFHTMPRGMIDLGYRIMEKTIRRDWNSPSVFAWLLANECKVTLEVLKEGKARCNRLDPIHRLVSAANDRPKEEMKALFEEAGMDFFDQHPYTFDMARFEKEADYMGTGKPLMFTEWGGKACGQSEPIMSATVDRLLDLVYSGKLAGHSFWSWQDVRQYSRVDAEMNNGVLESGVVTEGREPRSIVYLELKRLTEKRRHETTTTDAEPIILPLRKTCWKPDSSFHPIDLDSYHNKPEARASWQEFESMIAHSWSRNSHANDQWKRTGESLQLWNQAPGRVQEIAGVPFRFPQVDGAVRPLVCMKSSDVTIPLPLHCARVHVVGNVTLPSGYPCNNRQGQVFAFYYLETSTGKRIEIPLRWGYEIIRANLIYEGTRIDPIATEAQPVLLYRKDFAREQYRFLLYSTPLQPGSFVTKLTCKVLEEAQAMLVCAITGEQLST